MYRCTGYSTCHESHELASPVITIIAEQCKHNAEVVYIYKTIQILYINNM